MKQIYLAICMLFALSASVSFTACSDDDGITEISIDSAPSSISYTASMLFPQDEILKIEKSKNGDYPYAVYLTSDIKIECNDQGSWKEINFSADTPYEHYPAFIYKDHEIFLKQHFADQKLMAYSYTPYGFRLTLSDGRQLAFYHYENTFIGYESSSKAMKELPHDIRFFIETHFPDYTPEYIIRNIPAFSYDDSYSYDIWLDKDLHLVFDNNQEWTLIDNKETLLPASVIEALPEELKNSLTERYPDAQITRIIRRNKEYTVTVYPHSMYTMNLDEPTITIPGDKIQAFIKEYFGEFNHISIGHRIYAKIPLIVMIPNGFDIEMDTDLQWKIIDGHGHEFYESILALLPTEIVSYVAANYPDTSITQANHEGEEYVIGLTNGQSLIFNADKTLKGIGTVKLNSYQKAYNYIRYHYKDQIMFATRNEADSYIYTLKNGIRVHFDKEGNFIKEVPSQEK